MKRLFIPDRIRSSEAVQIANQLGCKIERNSNTGDIRFSHPLIAPPVKLSENATFVSRQIISFLREIAGLYPRKSS